MEDFTLKGSCLLTILIPMNFLIGDCIELCKKREIKRGVLNVIFLLCGLIGSVMLLWSISDPYYSFIWGGGIIVAIIQNEFIFRKVKKAEETLGLIEKISVIIKIIGGVILILIPYIPLFYNMLLAEMSGIVCTLCYAIYLVLGVERIGVGLCYLTVWDKKDNGGDVYFDR